MYNEYAKISHAYKVYRSVSTYIHSISCLQYDYSFTDATICKYSHVRYRNEIATIRLGAKSQ